jgi:hypothetical protein
MLQNPRSLGVYMNTSISNRRRIRRRTRNKMTRYADPKNPEESTKVSQNEVEEVFSEVPSLSR